MENDDGSYIHPRTAAFLDFQSLPIRLRKLISKFIDEHDALQGFAQDVMNCLPDGDIDGCDLQDMAVKHGLLEPVMMDKPCGEICHCAEFYSEDEWPVECYRNTELLWKQE